MQLRLRTLSLACALAAFSAVAACEDQPFGYIDWSLSPDTARLYSLARSGLNFPAGFDFVSETPVLIESQSAINQWDVALDTRDAQLVVVPAVAFGLDSEARVADMGARGFDEISEAPGDTALYTAGPLRMQVGNLYVVRTRLTVGFFGQRCFAFSKFTPIALDEAEGIMDFQFDGNPNCNDRRLRPPN
ncbi:MAG: hypothetical protein R3E10_00455 [Gemmatimonadota bacterium]